MSNRAYVEHVAVWVRDIHWHIEFFEKVLGMPMREVQGSQADPQQYWTVGGMQFMSKPDYDGIDGRLGHIGVMCEDVEAARTLADKFGVTESYQGRNWIRLPDGLVLELIQAAPQSVSDYLKIDPRT